MIQMFPRDARVVFIGDSITAENKVMQWVINSYKETYNNSGIRFYNCGVAGGTADFAVVSYEKDIMRYAPTHAVVSFGINDSRRDLLAEDRSEERLASLLDAYEIYKARLSELVDKLLADGTDVILCTPVPYDEYSDVSEPPLKGGYALMLGYAEYVRDLAKRKGVTLYDQHEKISRLLSTGLVSFPDRIHPDKHGYFMMAREFLAEQGVDIGVERELPEYFAKWHSYVARLRKVLASECMLLGKVGKNFDSPDDEKISAMQVRVDNEDFEKPVFESFFRSYVKDKPVEAELYTLIDEMYEQEIL